MKYVLSLTPVIFLMAFLGIVIHVYGTDALSGGSQLVLILSTGVCGLIAVLGFHVPWKILETEISNSIGSVGTAIVILLLIGLLSGTWTVSGVVPTLIYWGMKIIYPYVFLLLLLCHQRLCLCDDRQLLDHCGDYRHCTHGHRQGTRIQLSLSADEHDDCRSRL